MPPVKKRNLNKTPKSKKSKETNKPNVDQPVVSGQLQKKINKRRRNPAKERKGVVFIKHLPHGFYEEQLKKYFEQFGEVTRVRLARSTRTGNSKGYAFVEFEYPEVAEVAAETMDNYLMFKQIVKTSYIPPEKQQFNYFRTSVKKIRNKSGKSVWVSTKTAAILQKIKKQNDWSENNYNKRIQKQLTKFKNIGEKYADLGIDINKIIVPPKMITEEKKLQKKSAVNLPKISKDDASSKVPKRKTVTEDVPSNKQVKKKAKKVSLEDLLGNTLQEDSDDEDYRAASGTEKYVVGSEQSSDEGTYGFGEDSDFENEEQDDENVSEAKARHNLRKYPKKNLNNLAKASNVERFDKIVKRKPLTGGISKLKRKHPKEQCDVKNKKTVLQITAAKELAKPLSKVKGKQKPLKVKKNLKKVK